MELRRDYKSASARQLSSGILRGGADGYPERGDTCERRERTNSLQAEAVLAFAMVGEDLLPVGLLLRQTANDRQHDALAVEGVDEDDDQDDEEGQID